MSAALESVKRQTYEPIELIVVDNDSSDTTRSIAGELADRLLTKGPERSAQRNFGVASASGKFVLILDSDMVLEPRVVEVCLEVQAREGASAVVRLIASTPALLMRASVARLSLIEIIR